MHLWSASYDTRVLSGLAVEYLWGLNARFIHMCKENSCFSQALFLSFVPVKLSFFPKNCNKEENGKFRLLSFFLTPT